MQSKGKSNIKTVVMLALLLALDVVMSRFLSVNTAFFKLDTSFIPLVIAAYLYGPVGGMIVAGLGDLIGALLFPFGPYMPHFTLSAALTGLWMGMALKGKFGFGKVCFAIIPSQIVCSLFLNSCFLILLYGKVAFWLRLVQTAVSMPIQIIVVYALIKRVVPLMRIERLEDQKK